MPTIIEHAAFLIGQTPSAAARDAAIMAKAHIEAFRMYCPDSVTVGMDIYNIEAEALGCQIRFYDDESIPGVLTHPLSLDDDFSIAFSPTMGRIQLILDAAAEVKAVLGPDIKVNIGICGPFSVFIELVGFESAICAIVEEIFLPGAKTVHKNAQKPAFLLTDEEDERVAPLLMKILEFQKNYCNAIVAQGLGVTVFESWASPPLITPEIYRDFAFPYEKALMAHMQSIGLGIRPLVIGGDTRPILDQLIETGTTLLVSDYNTPLPLYIEKAKEKGLTLRANIDPKLVRRGAFKEIEARVGEIYAQQAVYPRLIIGTGVVPFDTPPENLMRVRDIVNN